ncbi:Flp pilus assembly protein CpaB [Marinobacter salinexigens]|uniref:Flp pilus assembly protein CpaB n=1 Tax=Marinobacter salinexigens TaxID=2919747 RepID=A0A5B0VJF4_9GAMM|nr:Flp pilus assembly protein CpaB [Marinobacter salinexigens]KAA1174403.1 Flp pilus assembly protein CpaB [Marinobacter salinexigens]
MNKRLVYALPAIVLALVALALAALGFLTRNQETVQSVVPASVSDPVQPEPDPAYEYLVAIESITPGTVLSEEAFLPVTSDKPVADAILASEVPMGEPVKTGLAAGQILSANHLRNESLLEQMVEPGFQAMAIAVDDLSGVGGLLRPGDRVDVTAVFRKSDQDEPAAMRLLTNILVLAVRGVPHQGESLEGNDQRRNATVVLSVPVDVAPRLLLASAEGDLRLAASSMVADDATPELVASAEDGKDEKEKPVYLKDLFPKPPAPKQVAAPPPKPQVEVYEGAQSRKVYVN